MANVKGSISICDDNFCDLPIALLIPILYDDKVPTIKDLSSAVVFLKNKEIKKNPMRDPCFDTNGLT